MNENLFLLILEDQQTPNRINIKKTTLKTHDHPTAEIQR
jgi:hypothetical protein